MDKFASYYNNEDRIQELSNYVHQNMKVIMTKMISEIRRDLDMEAPVGLDNRDGYLSLLCSLHGRMFNEIVYSSAGICQSAHIKFTQMIPHTTIEILFKLIQDINPLNGQKHTDVKENLEGFKAYYLTQIDKLRAVVEALPKSQRPS
jgi:hypothetical protein